MSKVKAILILTGMITALRDELTEVENKKFDALRKKSPTFLTESELKDLNDFKLRTRGGRETGQAKLNREINLPPMTSEELYKRIDQVIHYLEKGVLSVPKKEKSASIPAPAQPKAPVIESITQPNEDVATGKVVLSGLPSGPWTINPEGAIQGN